MFLFSDGFDSYGATANLFNKWNGAALGSDFAWSATGNQAGGPCVTAIGTTGGTFLQSTGLTGASNAACMAFRFKASAIPSATATIANDNNGGSITISPTTGYANFLTSGTVVITANVNVCDGNWHWLEFFSIPYNPSSRFYVDGVIWGNTTGGPFGGNIPLSWVRLYSVSGITVSFDDIIAWDPQTGPSFQASPINPRQITTLRPASDGAVNFANLSSGTTHYNLVNEVNPDTTSWVSDNTSGHQDLYNYNALGYIPTNISGVVVNSWMLNPNAGSINYQAACKSGATTTLGTSTLTPSSWRIQQDLYVTDPNTSAAWTGAGVNAAQFGIHVP